MRRWRGLLVVLVLGLALGYDLGSAPGRQWTARGMIAAIELYQATLSPLVGRSGVKCRFAPTCSHYGVGVIERYGAFGGGWRAAWRVLRCNPWTAPGTVDPP